MDKNKRLGTWGFILSLAGPVLLFLAIFSNFYSPFILIISLIAAILSIILCIWQLIRGITPLAISGLIISIAYIIFVVYLALTSVVQLETILP